MPATKALGVRSTMDWRGIEWAVPAFEVVMLVLPIYAFIIFFRHIKRGVLKKSRALWCYSSLVITPIVLYVLFFFALVGFEELTHISVITDGLARSFLFLIGVGLTIWLISILLFGVVLVFIRSQPSTPNNAINADGKCACAKLKSKI